MSDEEERELRGATRLLMAVRASRETPAVTAEGLAPLLADLKARASGLRGAALELEISRFVEAVIERHVASAPAALRASVREQLYGLVLYDPTMAAALNDLRSAITRG